MNLSEAKTGETYIVKDISSDDEELKSFLFTLGCYSGEPITVISHIKGGCVVSIKDGRYNIDDGIAESILIVTKVTIFKEYRLVEDNYRRTYLLLYRQEDVT